MKFISPVILALVFSTACFSQNSGNAQSHQLPRKYSISNSGCIVYTYCDTKYKIEFSDDSSKVFSGECVAGDITYGIVCVKLLNPVTALNAAEDLMIIYVDYLKSNFEVTKSLGYGKGHRLNNDEGTRGIIDYWEDKEMDKWKVKAWTNGYYIAFLYTYSKKELPETRVNLFLDSFRFPAM